MVNLIELGLSSGDFADELKVFILGTETPLFQLLQTARWPATFRP